MLGYVGAGDASNFTSLIELNKTENSSTSYIDNSLILNGTKINPKKLLINNNGYKFASGTTPNISTSNSSLILGSNTLITPSMNDETLKTYSVFKFNGIKPFFYFRNGLLTCGPSDIIYNNITTGRTKCESKTASAIITTIENSKYKTYFISNDQELKKINVGQQGIFQKPSASTSFLGIKTYNATTNSELYNLSMMKAMYQNIYNLDFTHSAFGEFAWGTGTSSSVIKKINKIVFPKDLDLLNYCIFYSNHRYGGRVNLYGQGEKIASTTDGFYIGLFDDKAWPLVNSVNGIPYGYKNSIDHITSNFYFYTTTNGSFFKNSSIYQQGPMILTDLLVPWKIIDNYAYEQNLSDNNDSANRDLSGSSDVKEHNDNLYWISLDKEQLGAYSAQTSIKILQKIEYYCKTPGTSDAAQNTPTCFNVCGESNRFIKRDLNPNIVDPVELMRIRTDDGNSDVAGNSEVNIVFVNKQFDAHKTIIDTETSGTIQWTTLVVEKRNMRLSCGDAFIDNFFWSREYYSVPINNNSINDLKGAKSKVKAETLLANKNNIMVRFKYITRKLLNLDNYFEKYIINTRGDSIYISSNRLLDESPIKNYFFSWFCNAVDMGTETVKSAVPPFYKMLNEMIFRSFFGSVDGIELKSIYSKTQHPHDWIPYEYDNSLGCEKEKEVNVFIATVKRLDIIGLTLRCWLLKKLVVGSSNKNKIVYNCIRYIKALNPPGSTSANYGIVPDKKQFDTWYENKDRDSTAKSELDKLVKTFLP